MPIAVNCLRGRKTLPDRKWKVPSAVGWVIDIVRLFSFLLSFFLWLLADKIDLALLHCFDYGAFLVSPLARGDR